MKYVDELNLKLHILKSFRIIQLDATNYNEK